MYCAIRNICYLRNSMFSNSMYVFCDETEVNTIPKILNDTLILLSLVFVLVMKVVY